MADEGTKNRLSGPIQFLLVAIGYWLLTAAAWQIFQKAGTQLVTIWPSSGLAVALLYRFGWRVTPGLMMGSFLADMASLGSAWLPALLAAVGNGLAPLAAVTGARLYTRRQNPFSEIQGMLIFLFWTVLVHSGLTAGLGIGGQVLLARLPAVDAIALWPHWWLAHAAGVVLLAPLLLNWFFPETIRQRHTAEFLLTTAVTLTLSVSIFFFSDHFFLGLPYLLIVPLAWTAARNSMFRTMLLFVMFVLVSLGAVALAPPVHSGAKFPLLHFTIMSVTYGVTLLMLATMKRSRDQIIETLQTKKEEIDRYFTSSLDLLCIADTSGRFVRLNPEWQRTLGFPLQELEGQMFIDFVHPDDVPKTLAATAQLAAQTEVLCFENRFRCQDGAYRWLEWRSHPQGDLIYAVARDVTDRKRVEATLANERRQLLSVFDSLDHIIYVADMDSYEILFANRHLIKGLGRDPVGKVCYRELQGLSEPCPFCTNDIIKKRAPEAYRWEFFNPQINGYFDIHDRVVDWPDGRRVRLELATDITDRKKAEEALRVSERKLSTLFDAMSEMVALHELVLADDGRVVDYRIVDCNNAYSKVTGVRKEDAVGRLGSEVYRSMPPPYLQEFSSVALSGQMRLIEEYYPPMKKHFLISCVSPGSGQFATITVDLTRQKQAEETIKRINDQLLLKNKELEQVVYIASHDLRSPLVNIDGYSRELGYTLEGLHKLFDGLPADEPRRQAVDEALADSQVSLNYIRKSAGQMDVLLSGLLRLSRSGRVGLHIGELDMNSLLASVLEGSEYQIRKAGIQVTVEALPPCLGDKLAVSQVLTNLIGNAMKYLDPQRPGRIHVSAVRNGRWVLYSVQDNGIGIAQAHQERIFDIFYRLEPGKYPGEGLGLTIVRQAVERLGGSVTVDSTLGVGSRFTFCLPAPVQDENLSVAQEES